MPVQRTRGIHSVVSLAHRRCCAITRPRLLAVSGIRPWPPRGGFSLRPAHLLDALAEEWDISLVLGAEMDPRLAGWCDPERHEVRCVPMSGRWRSVPPRRTDFGPLEAAVDAVVADRLPDAGLFFVGTERLAIGRDDLPRAVADRIDCGTIERLRYARRYPARSIKAIAQAMSQARYERRVVRGTDATTVVGEDDRAVLERISGRGSVHVVPNGVHADDAVRLDEESHIPTVVFSGTLSYYANADAIRFFVRRLWPSIRSSVEDARLVIAGRHPTRLTSALGSLPGVEVRVDVPDMFAVLREAWVAVAPMRCGAGVKNKVLEAWAVGRPAVMTPLAANGLLLDGPSAGLVTGDPSAFSDAVVELLRDHALRHRLGVAGHALARTRHTWRESAARLSGLLRGDSTAGEAGPSAAVDATNRGPSRTRA